MIILTSKTLPTLTPAEGQALLTLIDQHRQTLISLETEAQPLLDRLPLNYGEAVNMVAGLGHDHLDQAVEFYNRTGRRSGIDMSIAEDEISSLRDVLAECRTVANGTTPARYPFGSEGHYDRWEYETRMGLTTLPFDQF